MRTAIATMFALLLAGAPNDAGAGSIRTSLETR